MKQTTPKRGLDTYDRQRRRFDHHLHDPKDPASLSHNEVFSIMEDAQGLVWIGTRIGLNRYDPSTRAFGHLKKSTDSTRDLSGSVITAVFRDSRETLWVGTYGNGLNRQVNEDPLEFVHIGHDAQDPYSLADVRHLPDDDRMHTLAENAIHAIFEDSEGTLWLGTGAGLQKRVPGDTGGEPAQFLRYQHKRNEPKSLSHNEVMAIAEDDRGHLWVGTWGGGLDQLVEGERITFIHHRHEEDDPNSLSSDVVRALYEDSRGNLWIGTASGLNRLIPRERTAFVRYQPDPEDPHSLSHPYVSTITEDSLRNLWIGTAGGGLDKLDPNTQQFTNYSEKDGLSSNVINGALVDGKDCLWLSTGKGINKFDPKTVTFTQYGLEDGVQAHDFTIGVAYKDRMETMYFGGPNGLNVFHPDDITDNPYVPPVVLTDFLISNEPVPIDDEGILSRDIQATERIELAFTDSPFTLEFSALNYRQSHKNRFAYRLEGYDENWLYTDATNRRATYTRVEPGSYTFRVKAANDDGVWNETGHVLEITIVPPWWQTLWFRGGLLLVVLSLAYGGYRFQVDAIRRRNLQLEAKVAERTQSLEESEDRFRALSESTFEGIVIHREGTIVEVNPVAARMFGYEPPELHGKSILDLVAPESRDEVLERIDTSFEGAYEFVGSRKNGSRFYAEVRGKNLRYRGRSLRVSAIRDITQRMQREEELREAKEAAEGANRAKGVLLSNMSHELRTPLTAILGFAELMSRDPSLSGNQRENASIIGRSGEHLLGLINDVLEMSKIEAGRTSMDIKDADLWDTLRSVEQMMQARAERAGLDLHVEHPPDAYRYGKYDESKLRQVLINLIGNAIKYTPKGGVNLRVSPSTTGGRPGMHFDVEDTGVGIDADRVSEIFEPFVRHEDQTAPTEGTGLGLPISREYVRLMGGDDIHVASRPGKGSTFSFTLPWSLSDRADVEKPRPVRRVVGLDPDQPEVRILIVDDDASVRKLLRRILESVGFAVQEAANGRDAVERAETWRPQTVLMDMRLPDMDGIETMRSIRERAEHTPGSRTPVVVAITASALEEDRRRFLSAGGNGFLAKPFRESEIYELIRKHLGVRYLYENVDERPRTEGGQSLRDLASLMRRLPATLLADLERAAAGLDPQALARLIESVRLHDARAAETLIALAGDFAYKEILMLVRDAKDNRDEQSATGAHRRQRSRRGRSSRKPAGAHRYSLRPRIQRPARHRRRAGTRVCPGQPAGFDPSRYTDERTGRVRRLRAAQSRRSNEGYSGAFRQRTW
jgi:PAS domain S-box-containing protein